MTHPVHTFAIGDVHGRADLLKALLGRIALEAIRGEFNYRVFFLGDIIDNGPDSRGALSLVADTLRDIPGSRLILGNHEEMFLDFMRDWEDPLYGPKWLSNGGAFTINSFHISLFQTIGGVHMDFETDFPHFEMLKNAAQYIETKTHIFVHAGLRPGVKLRKQGSRDLRWIRDEFLLSDYHFGKVVVHGHTWTGTELPEIYPNRIALDTAAVSTGRLTALQIDPDGSTSFLCTEYSGGNLTVVRHPGLAFNTAPVLRQEPPPRQTYQLVGAL